MSILDQARAHGAPVIEGETAVFVWEGDQPPLLAGDFNGWNLQAPVPMQQAGPRLWLAHVTLPADAYVEYAYFASTRGEDRLSDPLNRRRVWNGVNGFNHTFTMPGGALTPLMRARRGVLRGKVIRHDMPMGLRADAPKRRVLLYQPPVEQPVPLALVWDGLDYYRRGHLTTIVDNLIAQGRMAPLALLMIDNAGRFRPVEYMMNDAPLMWVVERALPEIAPLLNLTDPQAAPGSWGVIGASMGGLMAIYAGLRAPQLFGRVLAQSPAVEYTLAGRPLPIYDLIRLGERAPIRIWQDVGTLEWLLPSNRRLHALLTERGYDVNYREFNAGHNYTAWANSLWRGLEWLFPPAG